MKDRKLLLAVGAALAAIVVGGGAALAASGSSNPASSFLGDVAKKLGISETKLTDAIKAAQIDRIDAAQARGDLTKAQADALKERIRSGDEPMILLGFRSKASGRWASHDSAGALAPATTDSASASPGAAATS